jgi:hypothetical protein
MLDTETLRSSQPLHTVTGRSISCRGEPARAHLAALWILERLRIEKPTPLQAAVLFGVTGAEIKRALDRAEAPRRHYQKKQPLVENVRVLAATMLSADELLTLAAFAEARSAKTNGSAARS